MANIITITFNPTIDKSTTVDSLAPEKKLRCSEPNFEPGGGGINVARAIKKLGGEALAIYPSGGHTGGFLDDLMKREGVPIEAIPIKNYTRENLIVLETSTNQQYRFGMPGPKLYEDEWKECLRIIEQHTEADYIVASGSLPSGVPTDIYARIAAIAKKIDANLIVDTSGEALQRAAKEGIYLLKPNLAELSSLVGREEIHAECVDDVAREIIDRGECEVVIVSMGQGGAMLVTKKEALLIPSPVVRKRSTVGAGDSMVAGIVLKLSQGWHIKEAAQYGVASGTAATMNPGTELCRLNDVEKLYKVIRKTQLKKVINQ
ncbi:MAG: 1-phosphofructokinase family hexose kinase [Flavisolibacter sp.]|nr:1-phosphofructokinase family hexose kinase [Flavisolibacter sp.]